MKFVFSHSVIRQSSPLSIISAEHSLPFTRFQFNIIRGVLPSRLPHVCVP